jgi:predicted PurR-regulated permease PerM
MHLSFQKSFFVLAFLFGLFAVLVIAKTVLVPLSMALLLSFILYPIVRTLENWGLNKEFSAFITILILFALLGVSITLFSNEIMNLSEEFQDFQVKIMNTLTDVVYYINSNVYLLDELKRDELIEDGKEFLKDSSGMLIQDTFSGTAAFLTSLISTIIFTFLFLIYRKGLTEAIVAFADEDNKGKTLQMLKNIQCVGKQYLSGMFLLILILGAANSLGLLIIGIDSPFFFGFLAAILSIIPFVGTTIGAIIPVLYAFMTSDSLWIPVAVIILFWVIQTVESNFLIPKIVGSSLNVNALAAILSLLIGASVWGIAGMVLFLPFTAIVKVVCEEFHQLKPIAMLISNDISNETEKKSVPFKWVKTVKNWFTK